MQITKVYVNNIQYLNRCGGKQHLEPFKRITNCTQGLQFRRIDHSYLRRFITTIKEQPLKWRGVFDDELLSFKMNSNAYKVRRLYFETRDMDSYSKNKRQTLQCRAARVDDAVQWGLRQMNQHKRMFFSSGSQTFVPDCLLDGTGSRWRCGERRKTMRWASVVRAQMQLLVETYRCNGRTQAAGVYRIDGMSGRRPPCRVCTTRSMSGCRFIERSPGGRTWWLRGVQNHHRHIADDSWN